MTTKELEEMREASRLRIRRSLEQAKALQAQLAKRHKAVPKVKH